MQDEQIDFLKDSEDKKLQVEIFMSELSRIRYLLRAYLRVRLQKVERHVMHILDNAGGRWWWCVSVVRWCGRGGQTRRPVSAVAAALDHRIAWL